MTTFNHSFSPELAAQYGLECAILISHFQYWINHNKVLGRNFYEGRTWTYQTRKEIAAHFYYWTEDQVRRYTDELVAKGVMIKGNFNKNSIDKTIWYAFNNEEMFTIGQNAKSTGKSANGGGQIATPIPNDIPNNRTNKREGAVAPNLPPLLPVSAEQKKDKEGDCPAPISSKPKKEAKTCYNENVLLTQEQYAKLVLDHGVEKVKAYLEILSLHKHANGKKYASDYHAILKWVVKAYEDRQSIPSKANPDKIKAEEDKRFALEQKNKATFRPIYKKLFELCRTHTIRFAEWHDHIWLGNDKIYYNDERFIANLGNSIARLGLNVSVPEIIMC